MSHSSLVEIINRAVADYGFRLAVIWGTEDVAEGFGLAPREKRVLAELITPELQRLPNPVEPGDQADARERLRGLLV